MINPKREGHLPFPTSRSTLFECTDEPQLWRNRKETIMKARITYKRTPYNVVLKNKDDPWGFVVLKKSEVNKLGIEAALAKEKSWYEERNFFATAKRIDFFLQLC